MSYDQTDALDLFLPIAFGTNDVAYVEQDSDSDIQQRVFAMLAYEPGQLTADPNFGIPSQVFKKGGVDTDALMAQISAIDPTVVENITFNEGWFLDLQQRVQVLRDSTNG